MTRQRNKRNRNSRKRSDFSKKGRTLPVFHKPIHITKHVAERYRQRWRKDQKSDNLYLDILRDFNAYNVLQMKKQQDGTTVVFTRNKRKYIVKDEGDKVNIITLIQHNRETHPNYKGEYSE